MRGVSINLEWPPMTSLSTCRLPTDKSKVIHLLVNNNKHYRQSHEYGASPCRRRLTLARINPHY
jgi:hypothetical protein